ncbi:MAG: amidase [Myxococcales bacterium]|nr:amidase [Myxococcales bacterium]
MSNGHLLQLSTAELADAIRAKNYSVSEVLEAHIERILAVNPLINAVVADRFALAREEAKIAERVVMAAKEEEQLPALLGVPCTVKEFWAVQGMPQTGGLVHRKEHRHPATDAEIVRRIRQSGAIVCGVTNVPEGGMWIECANRLYGCTSNPWDLSRTSGGSSGGDGAIVASGGVPFGIASDLGGSIRIPAAFCGAVGHKPTGGLVPNTGHFPAIHPQLSSYLTGGPIARRVRDLALLLEVMSTESCITHAQAVPLPTLDMSAVRVFEVTSNGRQRVSKTVRQGVEKAGAYLRSRGAEVAPFEEPKLRHSFEIWSAMMLEVQHTSYAEVLGGGQALELWREALKLVLGRSEHTAPALGIAALDSAFRKLPKRAAPLQSFVEEGHALQRELEGTLGERGIWLYPVYTRTAPPHNLSLLRPLDVAYTAIVNVLEFPATVVPVGVDEDGLPVAVQVIAKRGNDRLCLGVAKELESAFGGWKCAEPAIARRDSMIDRLRAARK